MWNKLRNFFIAHTSIGRWLWRRHIAKLNKQLEKEGKYYRFMPFSLQEDCETITNIDNPKKTINARYGIVNKDNLISYNKFKIFK